MVLPPCLIQFFDYPNFGGRAVLRGLTTVPLGRKLSAHRLSIQTTWFVSGAVWPQCTMQILTGNCQPGLRGRDGRMREEMAPLSSPSMTYYRLPIVTIGLISHRFRSSPDVPDTQTQRHTDRRNRSSNRRHYALKCSGR